MAYRAHPIASDWVRSALHRDGRGHEEVDDVGDQADEHGGEQHPAQDALNYPVLLSDYVSALTEPP
jgi:hypothetical protein